jgi:hypothetical protein
MSVQNNARTTGGGVTGAGFRPGVSGNPSGRPRGLSRQVRDLVGDDGHAVADFMFAVMNDADQRTSDRMDAAKWLADRGFGKSAPPVDPEADLARPVIDTDKLSDSELQALIDLLQKAEPSPRG